MPVNFALKGEELSYTLEDSGAELIVVDPGLLPQVDEVRTAGRSPQLNHVWPMLPAPAGHDDGAISLLDTALDSQLDSSPVGVEVSGGDLMQLLYTSSHLGIDP